MKYLVTLFFVSFLCIPSIFADNEGEKTKKGSSQYSEVMDADFDLEVESDGGKVEFSWDGFSGNDFKWWKLAYSTDGSIDIAYPQSSHLFLGDDANMKEAEKWFDAGEYNFRLCAITIDNSRYCGNVVYHVVGKAEEKKDMSESEKESKEKMYEKHKKKKYVLAQKLKLRVNMLVGKFIQSLEAKDYSNDEILTAIETVQERLEAYIDQEKFKALAEYMDQVLELKKQRFQEDTLGELEKIFEGY